MILRYESDVMDDENARGNFYHICQGQSQDTPLSIPPEDQPFECPVCGIDLEQEDFLLAQRRGWS
jgi:transcription initiation factor IIE alpha subunit